ncbi:TnsA endonuclease N terminal [Aromatoleum tolulyticum]|uniref:TnsA endonuclease N terminal n=2 Tax=Aromatoleum tolulyticum TaxID=34027 RepID=A0A1N6UR31_9RHOO|nr:TnsA endonuclease N terminal [Aromatoleum tolulyticum]
MPAVAEQTQEDVDNHIAAQFTSAPCTGSTTHSTAATDAEIAAHLPIKVEPKQRPAKGMSWKKLMERVQGGHGQGHGRNYRPWLTIRRKNPSPTSNQVVSWMPGLGRVAHYFSRGEYHTALMLLWLGVLDIREQFPLWPMPHPHPLTGVPGTQDGQLPWSRGLLKIAQDAGIDHGYEFGTRLPYVATLDLLVSVPGHHGPTLAGFSSKPIDDADDEVRWRTLERLELERRYCGELGIPYRVSYSALIPLLMAGQLEWLLDSANLDYAPHLARLADFFARGFCERPDLSITDAVQASAKHMELDSDTGWLLFRHCAWHQKIDIDLSHRILTSLPARLGGRQVCDALRTQLFGRTW